MKQLLPFQIAGEDYALPIHDIQEIVENHPIHPFPGTVALIAGAIGFHGRIVPVIDLCRLTGAEKAARSQRLIVLTDEHGPMALGVDQVLPILNLEMVHEQDPEESAESGYVKKIFHWDGQMISLFDLERLHVVLEELCVEQGG